MGPRMKLVRPWLPLAVLVLVVAVAWAPSAALAAGELTQRAGAPGCLHASGANGCTTASMVGGSRVVVSPDGKFVYTTGFLSPAAVGIFARDTTGALTQVGCVNAGGTGGCSAGAPMVKVNGIAISPDGKHVYVTDYDQASILVFARDATTGLLTQLGGAGACVDARGFNGCTQSRGLQYTGSVTVSPDGKHVYAVGANVLTMFVRDPLTGALSQPSGDLTCVSEDGSSPWFGACQDVHGLPSPVDAVVVSPDGAHVYARSNGSGTGSIVTAFARNATTGVLTQLSGADGCWSKVATYTAGEACSTGVGMDVGGNTTSMAMSPDGSSLYVPNAGSGLAIFQRNTSTGALSQSATPLAGCVSSDGSGGTCAPGFGIQTATGVAVSADGTNVYVSGTASGSGVGVFDRSAATGALTQKLGTAGCISDTGTGGTCQTGRGLPAFSIAVAPDGRTVYAGGLAVLDRAVPATDPTPPVDDGIGTQVDTPTTPPGATRPTADVRINFVGRQQALGNYPWTGMLVVSNLGGADATGTTVRIDGFHARADVTVLGGEAIATDERSGRSLTVIIDRVPARSSKVVPIRFTPVGPGHSMYDLTITLVRANVPSKVPFPTNDDTTFTRVARTPSTGVETGTLTIRNAAGTATVDYRLERVTLASLDPSFGLVRRRGSLQVSITAPDVRAGTRPPAARTRTGRAGGGGTVFAGTRLTLLTRDDQSRVLRVLAYANALASRMSTTDRFVLDCMQRRGMITNRDYESLLPMLDQPGVALLHTGDNLRHGANSLRSRTITGRDTRSDTQFTDEAIRLAAERERLFEESLVQLGGFGKLTARERIEQIIVECEREPAQVVHHPLEVIYPDDPNDKFGPAGGGAGRHVPAGRAMPYTIVFENKPTASAPAREVTITDQLDSAVLDPRSFALGPVWFGTNVITPPSGLRAWSGRLDLRPSGKPIVVTIDARIEDSGLATWHFRTIDPATGTFPEDPALGFLPPNTAPPIGDGGVSFTVMQRAGLKTGTKVRNGARIVFDKNAPIDTPTWSNTIDRDAPRTRLTRATVAPSAGARARSTCRVRLAWRGTDRGGGIAFTRVLAAAGTARTFRTVKLRARGRGWTFVGTPGTSYRFKLVPVDQAGNVGRASRVVRAACPARRG